MAISTLTIRKPFIFLGGPKGRGNLVRDRPKNPSPHLRLLRGVYPEQSEGLAMTTSGLTFSTEQVRSIFCLGREVADSEGTA